MEKKNLAFGKANYLMIAISFLLIVLGFVLMSGASCTEEEFVMDIFSTRRIVVAPIITLAGFILMIPAIIYRTKDN